VNEKQIEKNKIDITWDFFCRVYENRAKKYLQIFLLCLTFIFSFSLSIAIGECPLFIGIPIVAALLASVFYHFSKFLQINKKLQELHEFILKELDELNE